MKRDDGQLSWGLFPTATNQRSINVASRDRISAAMKISSTVLPRGLGRSYGDSCLNENDALLLSKSLDHFVAFDRRSGILIAEAGITLENILSLAVPHGWFLSVTPGTKYVTLAGAIANDVHGKNHHTAGSFGNFVRSLDIVRSGGETFKCSSNENSELFYATIGGMGLTGFIMQAELQLKPIVSSLIAEEQIRFRNLEEFFALNEESKDFEYTVSWLDCVTGDSHRGIFIRGNHVQADTSELSAHRPSRLHMPFFLPNFTLNSLFMRTFNTLYYRKNIPKILRRNVHYDPFFYPLDGIAHWNRMYGKRGFLQYQFVIPENQAGLSALTEILDKLKRTRMGSFLAVLKKFGDRPSLGMMSFPRPGITLALDFPNYGEPLFKVLNECDELLMRAGGAIYPAKDARMSAEMFRCSFPRLNEFSRYIDPKFSSSFWRRVTNA